MIFIIVILTTSSIGYLGILISVLLCTESFKLRYIIFGLIILYLHLLTLQNVNDFKLRVDAAKGLWIEKDYEYKIPIILVLFYTIIFTLPNKIY